LRQINELRPQPYQKMVKNRRVDVRIAKVGLGQPYLYGGTPLVRYPAITRASAANPDSDRQEHAWSSAVGNGPGAFAGSASAFGAGNLGESALGRSARSSSFHP
jgi:hypothetical protein